MKKNLLYFALLALAAISFASCSKENDREQPVASPDEVLTPIRISAVYEGGATTRVAYTEDGSSITATWQADDQLYVCYKGHVNTLTLTGGAGTATATFEGTIQGTPSASSVLICYVRDANNPSVITVADGEYTYASGAFTSQDGTMAGAAKCNVYYGTTTYGTGENITCSFSVNTSMLKFAVTAPDGVSAGDAATLTYKTDGTELAKASFTVGTNGENTIYMTVPAGQYTGKQTVTYTIGSAEDSMTLSASKATFIAGTTYSRTLIYSYVDLSMVDCAGNDREAGKMWTANCYMVHTAGRHKLPLVYGNAIKNGTANASAYTGIAYKYEEVNEYGGHVIVTATPTFPNHEGNAITGPWIKDHDITVTSAQLLWQDAKGLIQEVGISGDYLTMSVGKDATEQEGNALVAAKTSDGTIVWSWHIWVTKQTFVEEDLNSVTTTDDTSVGTKGVDWQIYKVAPVNLGWVGEPVSQGYCTFYQWGRKDPLIPDHTVYNISNEEVAGFTYRKSNTATIADNVKNPATGYLNDDNDGPCNTSFYNMWDAQQTGYGETNRDIKTATVKTVYDPCPAGFCVPSYNLFYYMANTVPLENFYK